MINSNIFSKNLKKYEIIIASALVITIVIILSIYLLLPNFDKAQQIFLQQSKVEKKLHELKKKEAILASIDQTEFKNNFVKIKQILPSDKDYVSLFTMFDNLQTVTGITIIRTDFQLGTISTGSANKIPGPGKNVYNLPVSINVIGNYKQLQNFISLFLSFTGRMIAINSIQWDYKSSGLIDASFAGNAFYSPLPSSIGAIDTPLPVIDKNGQDLISKIANLPEIKKDAADDNILTGKNDLFRQ